MSAVATLVVELVTEELPPKALKALGAAFADGARERSCAPRGFLDDAAAVTPYATPRRLAVAITHVRERRARRRGRRQADAGEGRARRARPAVAGAAQEARGARPRATRDAGARRRRRAPIASTSPPTARPTTSTCAALAKGAAARARDCRKRSTTRSRKLPIPKVMRYAGARRLLQRRRVRPSRALGCSRCTARDVVPLTALGLDAGQRHRRPSLPRSRATSTIATADAYAPTLEAEGKVLPDFAHRRAEIVRQLERACRRAPR